MSTTYHDNLLPNYEVAPNPYAAKDPDNDIWEGRKPHHVEAQTGYPEYQVWFGFARFNPEGDVVIADFKLNYKVSVFICGDRLQIIDIRYSGDTRAWGYCTRNGRREDAWPANMPLEDERIDRMLQPGNIDSPIWEKVCRRAREMWLEEIANRIPVHRYYPETS